MIRINVRWLITIIFERWRTIWFYNIWLLFRWALENQDTAVRITSVSHRDSLVIQMIIAGENNGHLCRLMDSDKLYHDLVALTVTNYKEDNNKKLKRHRAGCRFLFYYDLSNEIWRVSRRCCYSKWLFATGWIHN